MGALSKSVQALGWFFVLSATSGVIAILLLSLSFFKSLMPEKPIDLVNQANSIAVVEITGEILSSVEFRKEITERVNDSLINGIVVRIDSPGGAVGASEELFAIIREANKVKPVVCSMGNLAASGGLYAAMGCSLVFANASTLTGSIGVIMMIPNLHSLTKDIGLSFLTVKSGELKDAGSPFRPTTEKEKEYLQGLIDESHRHFVSVISEARGLSESEVEKFADGRIILGSQAKELKLIDGVGDLNDAAAKALELSGRPGEPVLVWPKEDVSVWKLLESRLFSPVTETLGKFTSPRVLYQVPYNL